MTVPAGQPGSCPPAAAPQGIDERFDGQTHTIEQQQIEIDELRAGMVHRQVR